MVLHGNKYNAKTETQLKFAEYNYNLFLGGNKYNARTELQFNFAQRIEKQFSLVCDFDTYRITRGRGYCKSDGCCSSWLFVTGTTDIKIQYRKRLCLYEPMRNFLVKKKHLILGEFCGDYALYIEDEEPKEERWA